MLKIMGMNGTVFTLQGVVRELRRAFKLPEGPSLPRSVRYWATEGLLRPTGAVHTGKGRNRIFGRDEILRAAILFECAKWNVTVGTMKVLLQQIEKEKNKFDLVEFVKKSPDSYMRFSFSGWPPLCEIVASGSIPDDSRSVLCIDVKRLVVDLGL
jgi:DNA-binding transcriptional MerR regulator